MVLYPQVLFSVHSDLAAQLYQIGKWEKEETSFSQALTTHKFGTISACSRVVDFTQGLNGFSVKPKCYPQMNKYRRRNQ